MRDGHDGTVETEIVGAVGHLVLNRPDKRNACSVAMWRALPDRLAQLASDPAVRLIALRGAGPAFCAGADLNDVRTLGENPVRVAEYCATVGAALLALANSPVPTVAAVNGDAAGGGAELALATDLRIMSASARILLPFAALGVVPDRLTLRRLLGLTGPGNTRSLLFGAPSLDAADCLKLRLVEQVVPDAELLRDVDRLAERLGRTPPAAVRGIKEALLEEESLDELPGMTDRMAWSMTKGLPAAFAAHFLARAR